MRLFIGPSGETWTHGLLTPSQARYQLRHTRIKYSCNAVYFSTVSNKIQEEIKFCQIMFSVFVNDVNQERQQEAAEDSSTQEYA